MEGQKRSKLKVVGERMQMLGGNRKEDATANPDELATVATAGSSIEVGAPF